MAFHVNTKNYSTDFVFRLKKSSRFTPKVRLYSAPRKWVHSLLHKSFNDLFAKFQVPYENYLWSRTFNTVEFQF